MTGWLGNGIRHTSSPAWPVAATETGTSDSEAKTSTAIPRAGLWISPAYTGEVGSPVTTQQCVRLAMKLTGERYVMVPNFGHCERCMCESI
jgi:hypothetical protein